MACSPCMLSLILAFHFSLFLWVNFFLLKMYTQTIMMRFWPIKVRQWWYAGTDINISSSNTRNARYNFVEKFFRKKTYYATRHFSSIHLALLVSVVCPSVARSLILLTHSNLRYFQLFWWLSVLVFQTNTRTSGAKLFLLFPSYFSFSLFRYISWNRTL